MKSFSVSVLYTSLALKEIQMKVFITLQLFPVIKKGEFAKLPKLLNDDV